MIKKHQRDATTELEDKMKTETQNMNWILAGIRESLEKMKEAQEDSEWDEVAQDDEVWE
jgi:hypothetical protein